MSNAGRNLSLVSEAFLIIKYDKEGHEFIINRCSRLQIARSDDGNDNEDNDEDDDDDDGDDDNEHDDDDGDDSRVLSDLNTPGFASSF